VRCEVAGGRVEEGVAAGGVGEERVFFADTVLEFDLMFFTWIVAGMEIFSG